jgi:pimeloyl-ACP methyl ester carboxylesterase
MGRATRLYTLFLEGCAGALGLGARQSSAALMVEKSVRGLPRARQQYVRLKMKPTLALSLVAAFLATTTNLAHARDVPRMVSLPTGSSIATWTLPATPTQGARARSTPIIFLHGGPGLYTEDRRIEMGQAFRDAGYNTVFYDQVGSGQSARLPATNYTLARMIADLEALRVSLGSEKIVLWGNSWGSQLAILYAQSYPNRVAGLIFTSPGVVPGERAQRNYALTKRGSVNIPRDLEAAINQIDRRGAAAEANVSQVDSGRLFDAVTRAELLEGMVCKASTITQADLPGGGNIFVHRMIQKEVGAVRPNWATLPNVPSLVLRGGCDFNPAQIAARYQTLTGATRIDLPNLGHGLLEDPVAVQNALSTFARGSMTIVP